ncbi:hypothetical protein [Vulgatibacter incomptus]|uniref:Uncharacterized protein n=1 Tax=Vulgatibacter incomptus TaxID=1391653 RepID=A0A0K1PGI8_9BACT|nr:hypothetical protein [Vulgatibacter incomptus]AKU92209.1 hypothetical protein AKJ08_2596 [Vulgatibacter incomptus]
MLAKVLAIATIAALAIVSAGCVAKPKTVGQGTVEPPVDPPDPPIPPPWGPEGPWPLDDVKVYGPESGLPGALTGVGVDDGQNVYVIDGNAAYAMPVGETIFTETATGGQFDRGYPVMSIVGGAKDRVYLGFLAWDAAPEDLSETDKLYGDVDRMELLPDGTLALEHHYKIQNTNSKWMDHTRSIFSLARVTGGPNHGDVYVGSNHGVTLLRGDDYADHRHAIFLDRNGSEAIGYVWAVNTDPSGNLLYASHWKVAALPPTPMDDVLGFLDSSRVPWKEDTWPQHLGPVEVPKNLHAVAGDLSPEKGIMYVGSWGMGLSAMLDAPRKWWSIPGTPDPVINGLELDPSDGKLWVATGSSGLWRWDPATGRWEQSALVPGNLRVNQIHLDDTVQPRALYAATDAGLYVIRAR